MVGNATPESPRMLYDFSPQSVAIAVSLLKNLGELHLLFGIGKMGVWTGFIFLII